MEKSILREIIEISATKYHILKVKSTKFDFGWDSASDPAGGAYSAPPGPLAGFKGPTFKGRGVKGGEGKGGENGERRERGRVGKRRSVKGRGKKGREEENAPNFVSRFGGKKPLQFHTT